MPSICVEDWSGFSQVAKLKDDMKMKKEQTPKPSITRQCFVTDHTKITGLMSERRTKDLQEG
jgi:hypothetical protein